MSPDRLQNPAVFAGFFSRLANSQIFNFVAFGRVSPHPHPAVMALQASRPLSMRDAKLSTGVLSEAFSSSQPAIGAGESPSDAIARTILASLDDSKAEDVITIDLRGKTALADQMMIATGRSTTHVGAIADKVIKACKSAGLSPPRVEGLPQCDWVLIDAGDIIVHIFRPEVRQFYNLEKMWGGDRPVEMKLV